MAWESVSICGFEMPDDVADRAYSAIAAYEADLGKTDGDIEQLREQAAWQNPPRADRDVRGRRQLAGAL